MKIKVSFEKIVIACLLVFATGIYLLLIWAIKVWVFSALTVKQYPC